MSLRDGCILHRYMWGSLYASSCNAAASVLTFLHNTAATWDLYKSWQKGREEEAASKVLCFCWFCCFLSPLGAGHLCMGRDWLLVSQRPELFFHVLGAWSMCAYSIAYSSLTQLLLLPPCSRRWLPLYFYLLLSFFVLFWFCFST